MTRPESGPARTVWIRRMQLVHRRRRLRDAKQEVAMAVVGRHALIKLKNRELRHAERFLGLVEDAVAALSTQIVAIDEELSQEGVYGGENAFSRAQR